MIANNNHVHTALGVCSNIGNGLEEPQKKLIQSTNILIIFYTK